MKQYVLIEKYRSKKCTKCSEVFPATLDFFHKDKFQPLGLKYDCKICVTERSKQYYGNHKKERNEYDKIYRENNRETDLDRKKEWYYQNKNDVNKLSVKNRKTKRKKDVFYKMTVNIRNLISNSLRRENISKKNKTFEILGCTFEEFKIHIENKFESWMNWDNYGKYNGEYNSTWNYDHIIPISSALNEGDLIRLNHYTNFQPLCSKINQDIKGEKIDFKLEFQDN